MIEPYFLGLDEIVEIHNDQLKRYGGRPGIRDLDLLKSAVAAPAAGLSSNYLHTDIFEMSAAYLFHIIRNHPFVDGNKRTGAVASVVFLLMNGFELHTDEESFENMVLSVAKGTTQKLEIARFFRDNAGH